MRKFAPIMLAAMAAPLLAQPAQAPRSAPGIADPARVTAGTYKVDSGHTQVGWRVNHLGFSHFDGQFADASGSLVMDPRRLAATRLTISIPLARVVTTSGALDTHLKNADFFDVAKYPTARFVSTRVEPRGRRARITGELDLHGRRRTVVLDAVFVGAGPSPMGGKLNIGFHATARIKRSDFGISYGLPMVADNVDLTINAAFEKL